MARRNYSKLDRERAYKLRELGCIVCINEHGVNTPPAIHHIDGQTKPNCHQLTIPLCPRHHQIKDNDKPPRWFTRHGEHVHFEEAYGTEQELLEQVNGLIA
tara:strand:- start:1784 stop:2086 length:303 start_codon:yes stop_codon:yes gene_type:complete